MNRIYKVIYCKATQTWVAVSEITKSHGKGDVYGTVRCVENIHTAGGRLNPLLLTMMVGLGLFSSAASAQFYVNQDSSGTGNCAWNNQPSGTFKGGGTTAAACDSADAATQTNRILFYGDSVSANNTTKNASFGGDVYITNGKLNMGGANGNNIAIGNPSDTTNPTTATGGAAVAVGYNASSTGNTAVAIGSETEANGSQALAIGSRATANIGQAVAIGNDTAAYGVGSFSLGGDDSGLGVNGYSDVETINKDRGVVRTSDKWRQTTTYGAGSTAIAVHSQALSKGSVAIGVGATAGDGGTKSTSWTNTKATNNIEATAIGALSYATAEHSTATGAATQARGVRSSAFGYNSTAYTEGSIAIGENAIAGNSTDNTKQDAIAIGTDSKATGNQSISIGYGNKVSGDNSGAFGDPSIINGSNSYSVGNSNTIAASITTGAFVLGNSVNADVDNSVYLGNDSHATATAGKTKNSTGVLGTTSSTAGTGAYNSATVNGTTYTGFAGSQANVGLITVGASGSERRIQNVAAGEISATSTDAINGSQLYSVANTLDRNTYFHTNPSGTAAATVVTSNRGKLDETAGAKGGYSVAAGLQAQATKKAATAIGYQAQATGSGAVAIGGNTGAGVITASGANATAINAGARATNTNTFAMGYRSEANTHSGVAIGPITYAKANAIGRSYPEVTDAQLATLLSNYPTALGYGGLAMGVNSEVINYAGGRGGVALGTTNLSKGKAAVAIGAVANATADSTVAIGEKVTASAASAVAIGTKAQASNDNAIALGYDARATGEDAYALGFNSRARGENSVALGTGANAGASTGTALSKLETIAIGNNTKAYASQAISIGSDIKTSGAYGIAIGSNTSARSVNSTGYAGVAIGSGGANEGASANGESAVAIGGGNKSSGSLDGALASGDNSVALGSGSSATLADAVALGSKANADTSSGVIGYDATGASHTTDTTGIWKSTAAAVSIGDVNAATKVTRQITDVAAGLQDTDAVNVAQLKAVATAANRKNYFHINPNAATVGGNATNLDYVDGIGGASGGYSLAAGLNAQSYGENAIAIGRSATAGNALDATIKHAIAVGYSAQATALASSAFGFNAQATKNNALALGRSALANTYTGSVALGAGSEATINSGVAGYDPSTGVASTTNNTTWKANRAAVSIGSGTARTRQITSVAAGWADTDAVNVAQLKAVAAVAQTASAGWNIGGNDGTTGTSATSTIGAVAPTKQVTFVSGDSNNNTKVAVAQDASGQSTVTITAAKSPMQYTGTNNADGSNTANNDQFTPTDQVTLVGNGAGQVTVNNVANAELSSTSKQAVNGSQLYGTGKSIANIIGGNSTVINSSTGVVTFGDTAGKGIGDTGATNIHDAFKAISAVASAHSVVEAGTNIASVTENTVGGQTTYTVNAKGTTVSGTGAVSVTSSNSGSNVTNYAVSVATDGTTITTNGSNQLSAVTGNIVENTDGTVAAGVLPNALTTAKDVASAINNSGFTLTTTASAGSVSGSSNELVNPGETVTIDAGRNIAITQTNGNISVATQKNVTFDQVNVGPVTINNATGINAGNTTITNVAPGVNGNDAVNVNQLNAATGGVVNSINNLYDAINEVSENANAGIAGAIAVASLGQAYEPGGSTMGLAVGSYRGENALSIGASVISENGKWILKGALNHDTRGQTGAGASINFHW